MARSYPILIRVSPSLLSKIDRAACKDGHSRSGWIRHWLRIILAEETQQGEFVEISETAEVANE